MNLCKQESACPQFFCLGTRLLDSRLHQYYTDTILHGQAPRTRLAWTGTAQHEEMETWNACADLLANCIVYYNAKIMSSFKTHCINSGNEKQKNISPASWEHIMLNGFYDLAENDDEWDFDAAVRGVSLAV